MLPGIRKIELGVPYAGWPVREDLNYDFGNHDGLLSDLLQTRIRVWARCLAQDYDESSGWDSDASRDWFSLEGARLEAALQAELGEGFAVTLNRFAMSCRPSDGQHGPLG